MPKTTRRTTPKASAQTGRRAGTARTKSSRPAPVRSTSKATARSHVPRWQWRGLSPERKLDLLGVLLALVGVLSLFSLLSGQRGAWVRALNSLAGWGAFVLPLALIGIGLWLVLRNLERLPLLSAERIAGSLMLYLNLLTWLHFLVGGGWERAQNGVGGGYLGAFFEWVLVSAVGVAGAVVALAAWLVISLVFLLDLSLPELLRQTRAALRKPRRPFSPETTSPGRRPSATAVMPVGSPPQAGFKPFQPVAAPLQAVSTGAPPGEATAAKATLPAGEAQAAAEEAAPQTEGWRLPLLEAILDPATPHAIRASSDQDRAHLIEETLASFGAPAHVVEIHRGPTVTQFGLEPDYIETRSGRTRVRVAKISALADDLALALAAPRIRIQAPVPGRSYVGIEVPNTEISRVTLREVMESENFQRLRSPLRFALGKDVAGKSSAYDLTALPHLLIAGTTGSGKSVCVNAILCCFLLNNTPTDLRLVLVDPKRVELTGFNGIPHLLAPVVVDAERVIGALQWMMREMDSRYHRFAKEEVRNIQEYNLRYPAEKLPYLVVVIDELADLMMLAPDETERNITRLAQLARATGIHLILATQRPSVDVVTGLIKANFPARIAFAVASGVDSRVILDQPGAERLLGRGDMLFQAPDASAPVRLQGVFVSDSETQRLVDYWRFSAGGLEGKPEDTLGSIDTLPSGVPLRQSPLWEQEEDSDPLLQEAITIVRREGRASITMLQRKMRIGYTRAARLVDAMEEKGIIGAPQGNSQVRQVLDYGDGAPPVED